MAKLAPPKQRKLPERYPVKSASPILKTIFYAMHNRGITVDQMAQSINRHPNVVSSWRSGRCEPKVMDLEEMADTLGFDIKVVPREHSKMG